MSLANTRLSRCIHVVAARALATRSDGQRVGMDESAVPAYLEYRRVTVEGGLLNAFNRRYDRTTFTTWKGSGMIFPSAGTIFEVDVAAGEYLLTLSFPMTSVYWTPSCRSMTWH
jgi:hypothetical protein